MYQFSVPKKHFGVMKDKEGLYNFLYIGHSVVVWSGSTWQLVHIFSAKSAKDITLFWVACLLLSEFLALPRALKSHYWVWGLCHVVSTSLLFVLLLSVVLYGGS